MKQHITISLLILFLLGGCATMLEQYQKDADIYRLQHLENYGRLIAEYHEKTGKYPFQGLSEKTIKVSFVTEGQYTENAMYQSNSVMSISQEEFRSELRAGLGREIRLWFDPQRVATNAPTYYLYVLEGDTYFFVVHLGNKYSFAANRGSGFNQVEISNDPPDYRGFWTFSELMKNQDFQRAKNATPSKSEWMDKRENENR